MPGNAALEEIDMQRSVNEFLKLIQSERPYQWKAPPAGNYAQRTKFSYLYMECYIFANRVSPLDPLEFRLIEYLQYFKRIEPTGGDGDDDDYGLFAAPKAKGSGQSARGKRKSQSLGSSIGSSVSKRARGKPF
jgi:hypothetical protein